MMLQKIINAINARGGIGLLAFAVAMLLYGGTKPDTPPVVTKEGIKLTRFSVDGKLSLAWDTTDDRIELGTDEFIIRVRERQIPARTGWSLPREIGRTKDTEFTADGFWRNRDIMIWIEVDKGAIE